MIHISMYDATSIQGEDGEVGDGWGRVVGWLSAAESDFADAQGRAAALWHVRFDDVALGEEDLEERRKLIAQDEFRDSCKRGSGNRHNRS